MNSALILRAAAIYNVGYGLLLAFYPVQAFRWFGMPQTPIAIIQCIGMMVGVYGLAYWIAGNDPRRYWPDGGCSLVGKTLGPIGFVVGVLRGVFLWQGATMIALNDLVWWGPFWMIVLRAWQADKKLSLPTLKPDVPSFTKDLKEQDIPVVADTEYFTRAG